MARHGREELVLARGEHRARAVFADLLQQTTRQRGDVAAREERRRRAHGELVRSGDGDFEPEALERLAIFLGRGDIERVRRQHRRHEKALARDVARVERALQPLHQDALVRRVHVDEHEPRLVLRQDVNAVQLPERKAERRRLLALARGQRRRGRGHERVVRRRRLRQGERRLDADRLRHAGVRDRRLRRARRERALERMPHELVHGPRVAKAHLDLGRMHVHIDRARVEIEEQEIGGLPLAVQELGVAFAHRVGEHAVAHVASVHEEVLAIASRLRRLRRAGEPAQAHAARRGLDRHRRLGELAPEERQRPLAQRIASHVAARPPVMAQRKGDLRLRERQAPEHLVAMAEFGRLALQELAPRRRVEVEVAHRHRRARRARRGLDFADIAALGSNERAVRRVLAARADGEPRYRGDGGERFASEAHGRHRLEVGEARDLARRVAHESERQLVRRDAVAVVFDLDAAHAAFVERDADHARAGVDAVLHQLLQHRGRALHHFAGRDLAHEKLRQHADGAHPASI